MENTKESILKAALSLFACKGYLGTSMSDIAAIVGLTKAALYKHYEGKQKILDSVVNRMRELDAARARAFDMPQGAAAGFAEEYAKAPTEKIRAYSIAQFRHWTEDEFSSDFRKMLTLEQYRDADMAGLYQSCLAAGPLEYMTAVFRQMTNSDREAYGLALSFYGPMYLLYSVYDGASDKAAVFAALEEHIDTFMKQVKTKK